MDLLKEFDTNGISIVYFSAKWCGKCRSFSPIFEKISNELNNIIFYKIDVDDNKSITKKLGIMSIPTIIFFKDGEELKRYTGLLTENELKEFLKI